MQTKIKKEKVREKVQREATLDNLRLISSGGLLSEKVLTKSSVAIMTILLSSMAVTPGSDSSTPRDLGFSAEQQL